MGGEGAGAAWSRDAPDDEGFVAFRFAPPRFNASFGPLRARREGEAQVRVRIVTGARTGNIHDGLHGGFALAAVDQALPVALALYGDRPFGGMVTLSLASQFVGAGTPDQPIDVMVGIVRETGRLFFLAGTVEQEGRGTLLSWQATMRKLSAGR